MNAALLPQVMVATARRRKLDEVLRTITDGIAQCSNVVLARVWLLGPSAECAVCAGKGATQENNALHLVASAGRSVDPERDYGRLTGEFHRFELGQRKIGRVAETGQPLLLASLDPSDAWIADRAWMEFEGVQTFAAQPLVFRDEVLGVLALFDRGHLDDHALEWLRVFADYAAVSIANARALDEIETLRARLEDENLYLREAVSAVLGVGNFIGDSSGLHKVVRQVQLVAPTDAAVLVTGESGTGKELVAREIHERSGRKQRPLIKVNCSAVPDSLFESEFFGHVKGAFTGAIADRPGRFELANHGTLFLDEVGELPLSLQAKLLRVLQEGELERVGDTRSRKVDVRIIAATNRDLKREVDAGRFRQDLFYRLSVFPIEIPALRERREDIPPLVLHFIARTAHRMNRPVPSVSQATLRRLSAQDWLGNVRELQNTVERAMILWNGGPLRFPEQRQTPPPEAARVQDTMPEPASKPTLRRGDLRQLERDNIAAALRQAGGKVSGVGGAAEILGMRPTTLYSRISALGLRTKAQ